MAPAGRTSRGAAPAAAAATRGRSPGAFRGFPSRGAADGRVGGMSEFVRAWLAVGFREMIRPCHIDLFNFSLYYPNRIN